MSRVHPSFCCTQQKVEVISVRHCEGEQHAAPLPGVQVEPGVAHIEHTPLLQVIPVQQSPSAAQLWPRARHWHMPPTQVALPQQSALAVQRWPAGEQAQVPPVHERPLQQSPEPVHAEPAALQQLPVVPLPLQLSAPQQRGPPVMHDAPAIRHASAIGRHWPLWQVLPEVQSESRLQPPPAALRWQVPERHESSPQQSVSTLQRPDSARQQRSEPCESEQVVPVAHAGIEPGVQAEPGGSGIVPSVQAEPEQARPEQQSPADEQAEPAEPQLRQVPPTQESDGLVQRSMAQQRWPSPPQTGVVLAAQRLVMVLQVKPGSHAAVPQHAWPSPPQAIIPMPGWQVPEVHVRPLLQAVPPQHDSLSPPHAPGAPPPSTPGPTPASLPGVGAASQVPPEQTAPRLHAAEPQHA